MAKQSSDRLFTQQEWAKRLKAARPSAWAAMTPAQRQKAARQARTDQSVGRRLRRVTEARRPKRRKLFGIF